MKGIFLALCLVVSLVACGREGKPTPAPEPTATATPAPEPTAVPECVNGHEFRGVGPEGAFCLKCVGGKWEPCK